MSGGGGAGAVVDPSILGGAGTSIGGGWMAAPGMADAGYGLPTGGPDDWLTRNFGNISNKDLSTALGGLGKGVGAAGSKDAGPIMPGAGHAAAIGTPGRGALANLDTLVQMLAKRREAMMGSATGGVGAGQAPPAQRTIGLLGM